MINEYQLAKELGFPVSEMSETAIKRRMHKLIDAAQIDSYKMNRTWYISPKNVEKVREAQWRSNQKSARTPTNGGSVVRTGTKNISSAREYLTAV